MAKDARNPTYYGPVIKAEQDLAERLPHLHVEPCPFCGGKVRLSIRAGFIPGTGAMIPVLVVSCRPCPVVISSDHFAGNFEALLEWWNTRAVVELTPPAKQTVEVVIRPRAITSTEQT